MDSSCAGIASTDRFIFGPSDVKGSSNILVILDISGWTFGVSGAWAISACISALGAAWAFDNCWGIYSLGNLGVFAAAVAVDAVGAVGSFGVGSTFCSLGVGSTFCSIGFVTLGALDGLGGLGGAWTLGPELLSPLLGWNLPSPPLKKKKMTANRRMAITAATTIIVKVLKPLLPPGGVIVVLPTTTGIGVAVIVACGVGVIDTTMVGVADTVVLLLTCVWLPYIDSFACEL